MGVLFCRCPSQIIGRWADLALGVSSGWGYLALLASSVNISDGDMVATGSSAAVFGNSTVSPDLRRKSADGAIIERRHHCPNLIIQPNHRERQYSRGCRFGSQFVEYHGQVYFVYLPI